jgi:polyisoprenoid-binding protein YceI
MAISWRSGLLGLVLAMGSWLATAQQPAAPKLEKFKADAVHSSVVFRIKHANIAYFYGRFNDVEGEFAFDESPAAASLVDIHVKAESIDTHNEARDKHLKSPEFFDVGKHKEIAFKSIAVRKTGANAYEAAGELTLHGMTRPLTVRIERTGAGPAMMGQYRGGFETVFEVKRSDFGMKTALDQLGDDVRLTVSIEGVRE